MCLTANITYRPSALPWAAYHGLANTVLKFLELGANIQATLGNDKRATSLHLASQNGHLLTAEALVQSGAEVDAQTSQGIIPLRRAVGAGHEHITQVLLENGAAWIGVFVFGYLVVYQGG